MEGESSSDYNNYILVPKTRKLATYLAKCFYCCSRQPSRLERVHIPNVAKVRWRAHPGWGLNIEFERSFGGKSRWHVRLQTGVLNICLPNNRVRVWATPYIYRFLTSWACSQKAGVTADCVRPRIVSAPDPIC